MDGRQTVDHFLETRAGEAGDSTSRINWKQAVNAFRKLAGRQAETATDGILRYIRACSVSGVEMSYDAAKEIIEDAKSGRRVWEELDYKTGMSLAEL